MKALSHVIDRGSLRLQGELYLPADMEAIVVFAHGSGSSRASPRNQRVAEALARARIGSFLVDLLTADEAAADERTAAFRFDVPLLASRVVAALDELMHVPPAAFVPTGLYGASTGAAAALEAAVMRPGRVGAIVSRGGRPDLAAAALPRVRAPTLFLVGGDDTSILAMHRRVLPLVACPVELSVVPGARHLFEEPGALDEVARRAQGWFSRFLPLHDALVPGGTPA